MRIIKDGIYIEKEYAKDIYRIKTEITDADKKFAKNENREDKLIPWDCDANLEIHSANLLGSNDAIEFPKILNKQKDLWYISIPSQLVKKINDAPFLKELRGLQIDDGNLKLKKETIFENLLYLSIGGNVSFKKENLPNLRSLYCKYKEGLLQELYRYDLFDHLTIRSVNDNIFQQIFGIKNLYGLQINRGKLDNIDGISGIKSLSWLSLDNLSYLKKVSELSKMDNLEFLRFGYCKHIANWDFLLDMPKLKNLTISANSDKEFPSVKILDSLKDRGISVPYIKY